MPEQRYWAYIKWGSVPQHGPPERLPPVLAEAAALAAAKAPRGKILELLLSRLSANIVLADVPDSEMFTTLEDLEADSLEVHDFVWTAGAPFPRIKATANFRLPLRSRWTPDSLQDWEEDHEPLSSLVNFFWKLDRDGDPQDGGIAEHEELSGGLAEEEVPERATGKKVPAKKKVAAKKKKPVVKKKVAKKKPAKRGR